jgi:hypothetical protein
MFDIEKEKMQEVTPDWEIADWEQITGDHARNAKEVSPDRIYRKVHAKRKERTGIAAVRYAALAIGLTAIGWAVRDVTWLAVTLGAAALAFGLISAYGAGKYREL